MFFRFLPLSLVLLVGPALAEPLGTALRLSFDDCVAMALRSNDQIRSADKDIDLSRAKLAQAHPRGIPIIQYESRLAPAPQDIDDVSGSFLDGDITPFSSLKIEVGSPISSFGKIKTAQTLANLGINASVYQSQQKSDEVTFDIYRLYQGILLARDLLALATQAQDALQNKISQQETTKIPDQLQILKLKVAYYEVERRSQEAKRKLKLALSTLKMQLGLEDEANFDVRDKALVPEVFKLEDVEKYIERAKGYLAEFKLLDIGLKAKESQLTLNKLEYAPNLGAGGFFDIGRAPNVRGGDDENSFSNPFNYTRGGVGLQLKGKLDFVGNQSKIRQAEADVLKLVYQRRAAMRGLELDIRKTYYEVEEAVSLMAKSGKEKKAARQMVFLTKSNLDIGIGDKKDYFDALQSYLIFQGREYEAIFNYNVAVSSLKKRIGALHPFQKKENS